MANVTVTLNKIAVMKRIKKATAKGQVAMSTQALKDANRYVKKDSGILEASSIKSSKLKDGLLIWDTIYAKRQYYLGSASKDVNPMARKMWAAFAATNHGKQWLKILQKAIDKGV